MPVEYNDLTMIVKECKQRDIILIEDISECVGIVIRDKRLLGTFGDFACASMYANKIVNAGDGGFVLCKNLASQAKLEMFLNHGFSKTFHFLHFVPASNCKINGMGAAFGLGALESLDEIMHHRHLLATWYRSQLRKIDSKIKLMPICGCNDTPWVFGIECVTKMERTMLRRHLYEAGIETRDYFLPLHLQPAYSHLSFIHSEKLGSTGFYLPTHSNLNEDDVKFICSKIFEYFNFQKNEATSSSIAKLNSQTNLKKIIEDRSEILNDFSWRYTENHKKIFRRNFMKIF